MAVNVLGIGAYLPVRVVINEVLSSLTGLDPGSIHPRTGIMMRYLAQPSADTASMAVAAAREALGQAQANPDDVRQIVVASSFHRPFPRCSTAAAVRRRLGLRNAEILDIAATATGFLDGLRIASQTVKREGGMALVIGSEGFSNATKLKDRRTCYLLSDGAGALLVGRRAGPLEVGTVVSNCGALPAEDDDEAEMMAPLRHHSELGPALLETQQQLPALGEDGRTIHVLTQASADAPDELPPPFHLYNPFAGVGHLLAASAPLSLYHLLASRDCQEGDTGLLFTSCAPKSWTACSIKVHRMPSWVDQLHLQRAEEAATPGEDVTVAECSPAEVVERIHLIASQAGSTRELLHCIAFRIEGEGPAAQMSKVIEEASALLRRRIRQTDRLLKLREAAGFALLVRHLDKRDLQRLCERLKGELQNVVATEGGEPSVRVEARFFLSTASRLGTFADEAVRFLQGAHAPGELSDIRS